MSVYELTLQRAVEKNILSEWHYSESGVLYVTATEDNRVLKIETEVQQQAFVLGLSVAMPRSAVS